jgi:hypothetical protein
VLLLDEGQFASDGRHNLGHQLNSVGVVRLFHLQMSLCLVKLAHFDIWPMAIWPEIPNGHKCKNILHLNLSGKNLGKPTQGQISIFLLEDAFNSLDASVVFPNDHRLRQRHPALSLGHNREFPHRRLVVHHEQPLLEPEKLLTLGCVGIL